MLLFLLWQGGHAQAQEKVSTEIVATFRVSHTQIESDYMSNAARLAELSSFLQQVQADSTVSIVSVSFCGAVSPEGNYEFNKMLARGRMEALEKWVRSYVEIPDSIVSYHDNYISWEYLASEVTGADISHKEEILAIINEEEKIVDYHRGSSIDNRVLRLQALDGGSVWRDMHKRFFKPMRNAWVIFVTCKNAGGTDTVYTTYRYLTHMPTLSDYMEPAWRQLLQPVAPDTIHCVAPDTVPLPSLDLWHPRLSIHTNLLGLGLAIVNAAVEADLCKQLSLHLPLYYSAWNYFTPTVKFRTFALQPEVRYWFSGRKLCNDGWFAGAHLGMAYYNIAANGDYRTQDHDGTCPALGGGLAIGYRMPISQNNRWKLEVSLGAGVYGLHYDKFRNIPNGFLVATEKRTYFGIDRAAVSISYTFGMNRKERVQ